jgi:O-antigen/teichoic acid export membrane protein
LVLAAIASSLGSSLLPYYGSSYGRGDHDAVSECVRRASRYTALIMFPLALGLASLSKPAITAFAGQQYEDGWMILAILSVFSLVYGVSPAFSNILLIYGKTGTILLINIISVGISFTLLPLTLTMGLTGLALMRGITIASSFLITLHFISKIIRVRVELESLAKTLISAATMAAITLTLQQTLQSNLLFPLYAAVAALVYITLVRELKIFKSEDADLLSNLAGRRLSKHIIKILNINPKT